MKEKIYLSLFFISTILLGCQDNQVKEQQVPLSDLYTDFPTAEELKFNLFNEYDILEEGRCVIDDSILWHFREGKSDLGFCYNLNTGKKLSTIASKGRATNEIIQADGFRITGDSVLLYTDRNRTIKAFAKRDITDNVPMGERKVSVTTAPDSIWVSQMTKLPNGSVLATIQPALFDYQKAAQTNVVNQKSVVIFNNKEANAYETIKYESFDIEKAKGVELAANDLVKYAYSYGSIAIKGNDMAVFSVSDQFILYTFNLKSGNVMNEKRYTNIQRTEKRDEAFVSFTTTNSRQMSIYSVDTNDKYILCSVQGYLCEEDKKSKLYKKAIYVFDWELNPIKKFDLPERKKGYYTISSDCSAVYFCEFNEEGLTLYKADLTM